MNWRKYTKFCLLMAAGLLYCCSCTANQPPIPPLGDFPGFWKGLWQGFIAPIAFLISLFSDSVRIYAFPNAGRWYDFGFMLGIGGFTSGIFGAGRSKKR